MKSLRYLDWLVWKRNPFSVTETFVGLLCNVNSELLSVLAPVCASTINISLNKPLIIIIIIMTPEKCLFKKKFLITNIFSFRGFCSELWGTIVLDDHICLACF